MGLQFHGCSTFDVVFQVPEVLVSYLLLHNKWPANSWGLNNNPNLLPLRGFCGPEFPQGTVRTDCLSQDAWCFSWKTEVWGLESSEGALTHASGRWGAEGPVWLLAEPPCVGSLCAAGTASQRSGWVWRASMGVGDGSHVACGNLAWESPSVTSPVSFWLGKFQGSAQLESAQSLPNWRLWILLYPCLFVHLFV